MDGIWFDKMVNDNTKVGKADNILNFGLKYQSLKVGCGNFLDFVPMFTTFNINMDNKDAGDVNTAKTMITSRVMSKMLLKVNTEARLTPKNESGQTSTSARR